MCDNIIKYKKPKQQQNNYSLGVVACSIYMKIPAIKKQLLSELSASL